MSNFSIEVIHIPNITSGKKSGRKVNWETYCYAHIKVTVTHDRKESQDRSLFVVVNLDTSNLFYKMRAVTAYISAHLRHLNPGQEISFDEVKAWYRYVALP